MPFWLFNTLMPIVRWLHIVGATLLLGGTLFYEFVLPHAVEDLKPEHQLGVLGRARWTFRSIVLFSTVVLILNVPAVFSRLSRAIPLGAIA